jgi:hypothetical protein
VVFFDAAFGAIVFEFDKIEKFKFLVFQKTHPLSFCPTSSSHKETRSGFSLAHSSTLGAIGIRVSLDGGDEGSTFAAES